MQFGCIFLWYSQLTQVRAQFFSFTDRMDSPLFCSKRKKEETVALRFFTSRQATDKKSLPHCEDRNLKEDGDPYNLVLP